MKLEALPSKAELPASMQEALSSMAELPASRAGASCFAMLEVPASVKAELPASLEAHAIPDCLVLGKKQELRSLHTSA